jgi:hypothetical protein
MISPCTASGLKHKTIFSEEAANSRPSIVPQRTIGLIGGATVRFINGEAPCAIVKNAGLAK